MGPGEPPQRMREYATRPNCKFLSVCPQKGFSVCLVAVPLTYSCGASREEYGSSAPSTDALTWVTSLAALNDTGEVSRPRRDPANSSRTRHVV